MRRGTGVPPVQSHGQDGRSTMGETPPRPYNAVSNRSGSTQRRASPCASREGSSLTPKQEQPISATAPSGRG